MSQHDHVATTTTPTPVALGRVAAVVVGLAVAVTLMVLAFATPAVNSGAHDLPLAVGGPEAAVGEVTTALDGQQPGAFDVTTYADRAGVEQAIRERDAIGGLVVGTDGVTVYTASAAGTPYAQVLRGIGSGIEAQGQRVAYTDLAPYPADDPTGAGITALALPLVFGGMISAVALTFLLRGRRAWWRLAGSAAFSVLAGLAVTASLHLVGTIDGAFWTTAGCAALGVAAISFTVLGLESLLGAPGFGVGAVTMLLIANPLSGMATGPAWLPSPWGEVGQLLPVGAAGQAVRSVAYFDGGAGTAIVVLVCWMALGAALSAAGAAKAARSGRRTVPA